MPRNRVGGTSLKERMAAHRNMMRSTTRPGKFTRKRQAAAARARGAYKQLIAQADAKVGRVGHPKTTRRRG